MAMMTAASEIAPNVFLGPSPDPNVIQQEEDPTFDVFIEASDLVQMPDAETLQGLRSLLDGDRPPTVHFEVPGSGSIMPPTWSHTEVDSLLRVCRWIWEVSHGEEPKGTDLPATSPEDNSKETTVDSDGDTIMEHAPEPKSVPRKVLIHCADGYTETTLLAMTYFMYSQGLPVGEAWIKLHTERKRNFFAYPTDVSLLASIQTRILSESPARKPNPSGLLPTPVDPLWLSKMDGSLPSRILPYMYLGNLNHANNPHLLKELGIGRIVSVGERVAWSSTGEVTSPSETKPAEKEAYDGFEFLVVENVQDNGVDALTNEFERCLDFIGRSNLTITLSQDSY
jgi:dual specificity MAP kinase phosphatase